MSEEKVKKARKPRVLSLETLISRRSKLVDQLATTNQEIEARLNAMGLSLDEASMAAN